MQSIPNIEQNTPYHAFDRVKKAAARVMLFIKQDKVKLKERMQVSEHPFGTVKWYNGSHYFLCRGKEKVTAEISLSFLAYNIRRVINMIGASGIPTHYCK